LAPALTQPEESTHVEAHRQGQPPPFRPPRRARRYLRRGRAGNPDRPHRPGRLVRRPGHLRRRPGRRARRGRPGIAAGVRRRAAVHHRAVPGHHHLVRRVVLARRPRAAGQRQSDRRLQRLYHPGRRGRSSPVDRFEGQRHPGGRLVPQRRPHPLRQRPGRQRAGPSLRPRCRRRHPGPHPRRQAEGAVRGLGAGRPHVLLLHQRARSSVLRPLRDVGRRLPAHPALPQRRRLCARSHLTRPALRRPGQAGEHRRLRPLPLRSFDRQAARPHHSHRRGGQRAGGLQPRQQEPLLHDRRGRRVRAPGALRPGDRQARRRAAPRVGRDRCQLLARRPLPRGLDQPRRGDRGAPVRGARHAPGQASRAARRRHHRPAVLARRQAPRLLRRLQPLAAQPLRDRRRRPGARRAAPAHPGAEPRHRTCRPGARPGSALQVL